MHKFPASVWKDLNTFTGHFFFRKTIKLVFFFICQNSAYIFWVNEWYIFIKYCNITFNEQDYYHFHLMIYIGSMTHTQTTSNRYPADTVSAICVAYVNASSFAIGGWLTYPWQLSVCMLYASALSTRSPISEIHVNDWQTIAISIWMNRLILWFEKLYERRYSVRWTAHGAINFTHNTCTILIM